MLDVGELVTLSLFGYFIAIADSSSGDELLSTHLVLPANICFIIILSMFVKKSYEDLFPNKGPRI